MKQRRIDLQRFQIGDSVRVTSTIMSPYSKKIGRVASVEVSRHARTLDKYVLRFPGSVSEVFWDIQLEPSATFCQSFGMRGRVSEVSLLSSFAHKSPVQVNLCVFMSGGCNKKNRSGVKDRTLGR